MNRNEIISLLQLQGGCQLVRVKFPKRGPSFEEAAPYVPPRRSEPPQGPFGGFSSGGSESGGYTSQPNLSGNEYVYKCLTIEHPQIDDAVIVETKFGDALAYIVEVMDGYDAMGIEYDKLKHVISKVDRTAFLRIKTEEFRIGKKLVASEINEALERALGSLSASAYSLQTPELLGRPREPVDHGPATSRPVPPAKPMLDEAEVIERYTDRGEGK